MARQEFQRPQGREDDTEGWSSDAGFNPTGYQNVSQSAQNSIDDIDKALRDNENAAGAASGSGNELADPSRTNVENARQREQDNPYGYSETKGSSAQQGQQSRLQSVRARIQKNGPAGLLLLLVGGGGIGMAGIGAPMLLLMQIKNVFLNDLSDSTPASSIRATFVLRNKINGLSKTVGICSNAVSIRCKFSSMSDRMKGRFEKEGFKFSEDTAKNKLGRWNIGGMTYTTKEGKPISINNPQDLKNFMKTPEGRVAVGRVFSSRTGLFLSDTFTKVLGRFNLTKASSMKSEDKKGVQEDFDKSTGADRAPPAEEGGRFKAAVTQAGDLANKTSGATASVGLVCLAFNTSKVITESIKVTKILALAAFAKTILTEIDKMVAGNGNPAVLGQFADQLTSLDTRKKVTDENGDSIDNPNYGKSPSDAQSYKLAAYGDVGKPDPSTSKYSLGIAKVGVLGVLGTIIAFPRTIPGLTTIMKYGCKVASSLLLGAAAVAAQCAAVAAAVTAATGVGGLPAGVSCAAVQAGIAISFMVAIGFGVSKLVSYMTETYGTEIASSALSGPDAMNAFYSGSSTLLGGLSAASGMTASNKSEMTTYLADTNNERNALIAADRYAAKDEPFNIYNQYSFLGSIVQSSTVARLYQPSITSKISGFLGVIPLAFGSLTGTASAAYNQQAAPLDSSRFDVCDDQELKDIGVDPDMMCNVRYSMTNDQLNADTDSVVQYMVDNGHISDDGTPLSDDYKDYLTYCTNRELPLGVSGVGIEDENDWNTGKNCATHNEELDMFGVYTFDNSIQGAMDGESSGPANTTPPSTSTPQTPVSGDAASLAQQILANPNITLSDNSKDDITKTSQGQPASPGPDGDGGSGVAGASGCKAVPLNPELLKVALTIGQKYQIYINDIVSGHQCDTAQHPKGRAMDIFKIGGADLGDSWWASDANVATINDIAKIMGGVGTYQMGFGVGCSAVSKINAPSNLVVFNDSCSPQDEIHIDVRGAP